MSAETIFDRARKAMDVGQVLGVAAGAAWRRLKVCPFCKGRDDFSYRADAWRCWKCGETGDAVDLFAKTQGLSRFDAACRMAGADPDVERRLYAEQHGRAPERKRAAPAAGKSPRARVVVRPAISDGVAGVIAELKRGMRRAAQSPVERYLVARGLPAAFERFVHFCPDAPYDVSALEGRGRRFPAMVCVVEVDGAPTGGLHVTYLRADGRGKIDTLRDGEKPKKMWGPQADALGRPGGILLARPEDETRVMCVAEGVENALSLAALIGNGCGAFAAGSLDRFQGGMARGPHGGVDWRTPAPASPAAVLRHKGPVLLAVDSDMKPLTLHEGTRWARMISAERRAQVSGVLATHWWRQAGASDVRVITPAPGKDVNDMVREQAA